MIAMAMCSSMAVANQTNTELRSVGQETDNTQGYTPSQPSAGIMNRLMNNAPQQPAQTQHAYTSKDVDDFVNNMRASSENFKKEVAQQDLEPVNYEENRQQSSRSRWLANRINQDQKEPSGDEARYQSFIERERQQADAPTATANTSDLVTRLGVNLVFVLVCAAGVLLLIKQWQKGQSSKPSHPPHDPIAPHDLRVLQVLRLDNGASLQVVDISGSPFLVAIDSTGIKSVKPLVLDFDDAMLRTDQRHSNDRVRPSDRVHSRERARSSDTQRKRIREQQDEPVVHDDASAAIDQKLIKLLLENAKQAAA